MDAVDVKGLRNLGDAELADKEQALVQEVFNLRLQMATGRLENPMKIRQARRDLARIKTIRRELVRQAGATGGRA
jgi:large subunit ribosomal protein L29